MRVDVDTRHILIGVRELAFGGERPVRGALAQLRTELGIRAHERYGLERAAEEPSLATEVPVAAERSRDGWRISLRGRVDGIVEDASHVIVEEVKSVVGRVEDAHAERPHARMQAQLYALCLDEAGCDKRLHARVVLISLDDGTRRSLEVGYDRERVAAELDALLGDLVNAVQRRLARQLEKLALADTLAFPYDAPRPSQRELIDTIAEGLQERRPVLAHAPTGIGKTVSALLPGLRFALRNHATLFYLTAKTTQREHVAATFGRMVGDTPGKLLAVTLRRRDQMCPPGDLRCHPEICPLLQDYDKRASDVVESLANGQVYVTPERIFERGVETTLCPYELTTDLAARADLVIGDYNHVFDAAVPKALAETARRRVVVVDEAHNLFDRARGYDSPFVGRRMLKQVAATLEDEPLDDAWREVLADIRRTIDKAAAYVTAEELASYDGCAELDLTKFHPERLAAAAGLLALRWTQRRWRRRETSRDDPVLELAATLLQLAELSTRQDPALVGYVAGEEGPEGHGIGLVCVDPARRLASSHKASLGTVAMSATLSPLDYFSEVLGFSKQAPILTSAPSPFPPEQREVVVAADIVTTFNEREEHVPAIAALIERIVALRPGSYMAFFPSYRYLSDVRAMLSLPREQLLVQLPGSLPAMRAQQLAQLKGDAPRLLLAVMGGVFAEGIDLPGDALIGAIVVGPALPPLTFERLMMRRHYDQQHDAGFAYAMVYPGLQRVVQAAGRVIRSENDCGIIALLGRRFAEAEYAACLPADWYRYEPRELVSEDPLGRIAAFWRENTP